MKVFLVMISCIFSINSYSQLCEMYEIKDIPVYFSIVSGEKNVSKVNDSLSFSILKKSNQKYVVEKLLNGVVLSVKEYVYKGSQRHQIFKIKKRKIDGISFIKQKKTICLLE